METLWCQDNRLERSVTETVALVLRSIGKTLLFKIRISEATTLRVVNWLSGVRALKRTN